MFLHPTQQVAYLDITIAPLVQLAEDFHIILQRVLLEWRELRLPTRAAATHTLKHPNAWPCAPLQSLQIYVPQSIVDLLAGGKACPGDVSSLVAFTLVLARSMNVNGCSHDTHTEWELVA